MGNSYPHPQLTPSWYPATSDRLCDIWSSQSNIPSLINLVEYGERCIIERLSWLLDFISQQDMPCLFVSENVFSSFPLEGQPTLNLSVCFSTLSEIGIYRFQTWCLPCFVGKCLLSGLFGAQMGTEFIQLIAITCKHSQ